MHNLIYIQKHSIWEPYSCSCYAQPDIDLDPKTLYLKCLESQLDPCTLWGFEQILKHASHQT